MLALCFSEAKERYHLWRSFTHGTDGVCIEFVKEGLLASFVGKKNVESCNVTYKQVKEYGG